MSRGGCSSGTSRPGWPPPRRPSPRGAGGGTAWRRRPAARARRWCRSGGDGPCRRWRMSRPRPRPHIAASGSWSLRMTNHRGTEPATASGTRARSLAVMAPSAPARLRTAWGTASALAEQNATGAARRSAPAAAGPGRRGPRRRPAPWPPPRRGCGPRPAGSAGLADRVAPVPRTLLPATLRPETAEHEEPAGLDTGAARPTTPSTAVPAGQELGHLGRSGRRLERRPAAATPSDRPPTPAAARRGRRPGLPQRERARRRGTARRG